MSSVSNPVLSAAMKTALTYFVVFLAAAIFIAVVYGPAVGAVSSERLEVTAVEVPPPDDATVQDTLFLAGRYVEGGVANDTTFNYPVMNGMASTDGYPIYLVECRASDHQCFDLNGLSLGSEDHVAEYMSTVRNADVLKEGWHCDALCTDADGRLVGSVSPAMLRWLNESRRPVNGRIYANE